jgi:hypothetical protein
MTVTSPFPRSALFLIPTIGLSASYRKGTKVTLRRKSVPGRPEAAPLVVLTIEQSAAWQDAG